MLLSNIRYLIGAFTANPDQEDWHKDIKEEFELLDKAGRRKTRGGYAASCTRKLSKLEDLLKDIDSGEVELDEDTLVSCAAEAKKAFNRLRYFNELYTADTPEEDDYLFPHEQRWKKLELEVNNRTDLEALILSGGESSSNNSSLTEADMSNRQNAAPTAPLGGGADQNHPTPSTSAAAAAAAAAEAAAAAAAAARNPVDALIQDHRNDDHAEEEQDNQNGENFFDGHPPSNANANEETDSQDGRNVGRVHARRRPTALWDFDSAPVRQSTRNDTIIGLNTAAQGGGGNAGNNVGGNVDMMYMFSQSLASQFNIQLIVGQKFDGNPDRYTDFEFLWKKAETQMKSMGFSRAAMFWELKKGVDRSSFDLYSRATARIRREL